METTTKKTKRNANWSQAETFLFIDICKEEKVLQKMDGKRFRWNEVMLPVLQQLEQSELNFNRDVDQLTNKLKSLKTEYRKAVTQNGKSGEAPSKFIYFDEMEELMGARPRKTFPIAFAAESLIEIESEVEIEEGDEMMTADESIDEVTGSPSGEGSSYRHTPSGSTRSVPAGLSDPGSSGEPSAKKKKKVGRSYGAALQEFSEDIMTRYKEANNEFIEQQERLQARNEEFQRELLREDREFIKSLFDEN